MQGAGVELQLITDLVPDWRVLAARVSERGITPGAIVNDLGKQTAYNFALLDEVGPANLFQKLVATPEIREKLLRVIRDSYLLALTHKMFRSNGTIRRFFSERRIPLDDQKSQLMSMAVDVAWKLEGSLRKNVDASDPKGFKVLLPAYVQTSVNNAILDHIKAESQWERQIANPSSDEDGQDDDPISRAPDDLSLIPDQLILSQEKVSYLNQLRTRLRALIGGKQTPDPALVVVDCMFGLGLTKHSTAGEEKTMRECCEALNIEGETQARKIARCQVLLDKGLGMIREVLREELPGAVQCWQTEVNVNVASKRDLNHRLDLTEGEVDRLIVNRQYLMLEHLSERSVVKSEKLPTLKDKGAVAAFVPVDLNSCTPREMTDILGLSKDLAKKIVDQRPLARVDDLIDRKLVEQNQLAPLKQRGAVVKTAARRALTTCRVTDLQAFDIPAEKAERILRGGPFRTWGEVEDFLGSDERTWAALRKNFNLSENSA